MYRTIIQLTEEQKACIAQFCSSENISQSALIRQAVDEFINRHDNTRKAAKDVFGIWKNRKIDGLECQNALRQEWE